MIKVSVLYPYVEGGRFDMDYYCNSHLPMVKEKLGEACQGIAADQGIAGGMPGSSPTYVAAGHLFFESVEAFQSAFAPHAGEILGDIPNYSDVQPVVQISTVLINAGRGQTDELRRHGN